MTNDILIFAEQREDKVHPAALQIVTPAKDLAAKSGGQVVACVVGDKTDATCQAVEGAGADKIVTVSDPSLGMYSVLRYRTAVAAVLEKVQPKVVLLPATFMGRDLAPRLAAKVGAALATDAVELKLGDDGGMDVRRPVYNGKAFCHLTFPKDRVAIATVRPNTFAAGSGGSGAARESVAFAADDRV